MSELAEVSDELIDAISDSRREPKWLREFRMKSLNLFRKLPVELSPLYTKYVDLAGVDLESTNIRLPEPLQSQTESAISKLKSERALTLYQIEGKTIQPDLPEALRKEGLEFTDIGTAINHDPEFFKGHFLEKAILPEQDKFAALNNALFTAGLFLHVPKGIELTIPLRHVTVLDSAGYGLFSQNVVIADNRSKFTFVEELYSMRPTAQAKRSTYSSISEVHLHDGADVTYASINDLASNFNVFLNKKSIGKRDSNIVWSSGQVGGAYVRSRLESVMEEPGASSENVEVVFGASTQRFDTVSNITHIGPNTSGHAISKGVVKDKARSLFKGMIKIEKNAKNSRAYLAEHAMILGKDARADAIPGLE